MQRTDTKAKTISKRVLPRTRHSILHFMQSIASAITSKYKNNVFSKELPEQQIVFRPENVNNNIAIPTIQTESIIIPTNLSFELTPESAINIFNQINAIMLDRTIFTSLLRELDQQLGYRLNTVGIHFTPADLPEYLLLGMAYHMPGPPPSHYILKHKQQILDKLLLEYEQRNQINMEGVTPKFIGIVDAATSSKFIAEGHLFTEDKQITRMTIHGSHTHRLQLHALCMAIKSGLLNLTDSHHQALTPKQLLEFLVYVEVNDDNNTPVQMWNILLDDTSIDSYFKLFKPQRFSYSCRSPDNLNALLLCFGSDFALPNLQHYLLDSHWKAINQMINRTREYLAKHSKIEITNARLYTYCMEEQEKSAITPSNVGGITLFSLTEEEASQHSKTRQKYQPLNASIPNIVVKKRSLE